jgi:hypothetical protein
VPEKGDRVGLPYLVQHLGDRLGERLVVRAPMRHKTLLILVIANSIGDRSGE